MTYRRVNPESRRVSNGAAWQRNGKAKLLSRIDAARQQRAAAHPVPPGQRVRTNPGVFTAPSLPEVDTMQANDWPRGRDPDDTEAELFEWFPIDTNCHQSSLSQDMRAAHEAQQLAQAFSEHFVRAVRVLALPPGRAAVPKSADEWVRRFYTAHNAAPGSTELPELVRAA